MFKRISTLIESIAKSVSDQWPKNWKQAIPNLLTLYRLACGPLIFICLWAKAPVLAWYVLLLFTTAALTDFLDGALARLWKTQSWLGQVLDPVADKILVASVLIGLIAFRPTSVWVNALVYILLMRELLVSGLREASKGDDTLAVSILGKAKTMLQLVALFVLLAENAVGLSLHLGFAILGVSAVLSVLSLVQYLVRVLRQPPAPASSDTQAPHDAKTIEGDSA